MPEGREPEGQLPGGRLMVRKTYKLFIGGAFPRSESGRSYPICGSGGQVLANAALASRKDLREAVVAARKAQPGWAKATAYLRGQVVYRVAEMLEGRHAQFVDALVAGEGLDAGAASSTVDAAVDRLVWYAGWSDKFAQVAGSSNPIAGPYFNFSFPEPTGVVGVLAPQTSSLLGLVSVIAPVITTGNAVVVVACGAHPLPALEQAEVLATYALDLAGAAPEAEAELEVAAADNVKRVLRRPPIGVDWSAEPGPARLVFFTEIKTVWHPVGV